MSCEQYQELLVSQLCGEIQEAEEVELQQHLESCEECRKAQREFRGMLGLMRQLPARKWDETLRIKDLLRRQQRWRAIVFSKAAVWILSLSALIGVISYLPVRWEVSAHEFSLHWGKNSSRQQELSRQLRELQIQLVNLQKQNQSWNQVSEMRIKQMLDQNNVAQEKRYWQTLQLFTNYQQVQRKVDLQKMQHDIATNYDRTGHEVEKANELMEYLLRASTSQDNSYGNK